MLLAEESTFPFASMASAKSPEAKSCFTPVWASSKLPFTAMTWVFSPPVVVICSFCTLLTPSMG